jgi:lysophospholipase L1-like esterase
MMLSFLLFSSLFHSSKGFLRITCIGDSITEGGACNSTSYTNNLQDLFGTENALITNTGLSSQTMLKKGLCNDLTPCSYWDTENWQMALDSQPDLVTIFLGTNDAKYFNWEGIQQNSGDYYALDYVDMIKQLSQLQPRPEIYLIIPPPLYEPYPYDMNGTIINEIYPVLIRDIARVTDATIIDIYETFRQAERFSSAPLTCDGCHPNAQGNQIIADKIYETIQANSARHRHRLL